MPSRGSVGQFVCPSLKVIYSEGRPTSSRDQNVPIPVTGVSVIWILLHLFISWCRFADTGVEEYDKEFGVEFFGLQEEGGGFRVEAEADETHVRVCPRRTEYTQQEYAQS